MFQTKTYELHCLLIKYCLLSESKLFTMFIEHIIYMFCQNSYSQRYFNNTSINKAACQDK